MAMTDQHEDKDGPIEEPLIVPEDEYYDDDDFEDEEDEDEDEEPDTTEI